MAGYDISGGSFSDRSFRDGGAMIETPESGAGGTGVADKAREAPARHPVRGLLRGGGRRRGGDRRTADAPPAPRPRRRPSAARHGVSVAARPVLRFFAKRNLRGSCGALRATA